MDDTAYRLHHLVMDFVREFRLLEPEWTGSVEQGSVSLSQAFALHELSAAGAMSQGELAERLHLDKSTASRMAAALERRGLLLRERDPGNRRLYRLRLTCEGGLIAASDRRFFFASAGGRVYGVRATRTGEVLWNLSLGEPFYKKPFFTDEKIFITSAYSHLFCLDASTGEPLWEPPRQNRPD
jgi:DNA-binding MarR family transcriptional regulator